MNAIGYKENLPIENAKSLQDVQLEIPRATGRDILVEIKAISVNPADYKVRLGMPVDGDNWKVIGWDATGIVKDVGDKVTLFKAGDEVYYAGDFTRQGSYAQYQIVDERIVGKKPSSLSYAEAAALPLTTLTAWEMLFDRLDVNKSNNNKSILIIGAAGGVGSIMVQLVKKLTNLKIIGTASRKETSTWLQDLGVDRVINHRNKLSEELDKNNLPAPDYVVSLNATEHHIDEIVKLIKPQGKFGFIDDPKSINIMPFKSKAVSIHIELMFTRSMFQTADMIEQHNILNKASELIDNGTIKTTLGDNFGIINAENLRKAHAFLETGKAKGKIVLEGF
ncbi:zinc-binding alcohol dehydrogenase family protein [Rasiella rasia]|uniref:Zinc-type alcohol dehydrogenase-like protein n=1 Tax=Rasiella rasia TaxID=2744027 RepID=A0A6G6GQZ2_9FLAO|nr:zinc-binding alcohol dehydrogenase family protein [Rasiella rasia]QIE60880.1 zinc-binding alcohol dehydrogenase family protein [Rasiella rasia]